jgi:hypothetical protein
MPPDMVQRVLECAPPDVVLIGGQALAYWMGYYAVQSPSNETAAISRDVDFFTPDASNAEPLNRFAHAIRGRAEIRHNRGLSALIGSAVASAEEGRVYNVDLVHDVVGLTRDSVDANAVSVPVPGTRITLRVMHPLDVLQSRNANLHSLVEKQDEAGRLQLCLAIEVARVYLEQQMDTIERDTDQTAEERRRARFDVIGAVSGYSAEDAARKNAERYGIHLADAIPAWRMDSDAFWQKQWPHLSSRMSPAYARLCQERAGKA